MERNRSVTALRLTNSSRSALKVPDIGNRCPLTGQPGIVLRRREPSDLVASYEAYLDVQLPELLQTRYFSSAIAEYHCAESGLRWYSPTLLGGSDFYEYLETFPWYYGGESWDKLRTIELLSTLRAERFVDIGSGEGLLLGLARARGIDGFGVEMNPTAVAKGCAAGRRIYLMDDPALQEERADVLVTLQTLEHVNDPRAWLSANLERFDARYAIIAVPCHDTMLGKTSDPLAWPPHHGTLWSGRALRVLATQIGYRIVKLEYEPNTWRRFNCLLDREPSPRRLGSLPRFPRGRAGSRLFRVLYRLNIPWVTRAHTALALMERV